MNCNKVEITKAQSLLSIIQQCLVIYLFSRIIIAFEYSSVNLLLQNNKSLVDNLWRWDAPIYADIATHGYVASQNWPWFPLWPIVLRICSLNLLIPLSYTALILSQMLFFASMVLFWLYLDKIRVDQNNIVFIVVMLAISPANIYFCAGLSEPLYLFLSLLCFYCLMNKHIKLVLLTAGLLSATRMTGEFIVIPIIYHWYISRQFSLRKLLLFVPIMSSGLIAFMLYLKIVSGDFLMFIHAETARNRTILSIPQLWDQVFFMFRHAQIYDAAIFLITIFLITFLLLKARYYKETIFNVLNILPGYISGTLWNSFRFDTAIFTFYLGLGVLAAKSTLYKYTIATVLGIMSYICWFYWLSGSWYFA